MYQVPFALIMPFLQYPNPILYAAGKHKSATDAASLGFRRGEIRKESETGEKERNYRGWIHGQ